MLTNNAKGKPLRYAIHVPDVPETKDFLILASSLKEIKAIDWLKDYDHQIYRLYKLVYTKSKKKKDE